MASEETAESGDEGTPSGELHSVLESDDRRRILRILRDRTGEIATLEELVDLLVEREDGYSDPAAAAIALHHAELPRLAEVGALDYDPRTKVTRYRGHPRLEALLPRATVA